MKPKKGAKPTAEQLEYWDKLREIGCIICRSFKKLAIHHCKTGAGGTKDHDKVIPLCHFHHQGEQGLHTLGRPVWQAKYGTEEYWMEVARDRVEELA